VTSFWLEHSLDREHGGYFNCLDQDGTVYDTTKHMWLQSRMVWMFSRLYNSLEQRPEWLDAARLGLEFIREHGKTPEGRVYFSLTADGRPVALQRKLFSECFYSMALDEYSRATGDNALQREALEMFATVVQLADNPALLGRPVLAGQRSTQSLAIPMMMLCAAEQLSAGRSDFPYAGRMTGWVSQIFLHADPARKLVRENVAPDGSVLPGSEGRILNPGHAIEAGWFVLEYLLGRGITEGRERALEMIDWSFELGWDKDHGGIFYFLDSDGHSPVPLEWPMKLWWPLCESLYGMLLAWSVTGKEQYIKNFLTTWSYIDTHLIDKQHGEWYGYLDREGRPTHRFKGGPYKCFFHVPRALLFCVKLLEKHEN
jgi:N-acylglucosamine 2-epimerase